MVSTRRSSRLRGSTPLPLPQIPGAFQNDAPGNSTPTPAKLAAVAEDQVESNADTVPSPAMPSQKSKSRKDRASPDSTPSRKFTGFLSPLNMLTPKAKTTIVPAHDEMHPSQHQRSTTKPLEEARWLGFMPMAPHTEPPKKTEIRDEADALAVAQATPTRATQSANKDSSSFLADYDFSFHPKASVDSGLSPEARRIMEETRGEAAKIRALMTAAKEKQENRDRQAADQPVFGMPDVPGRKIAKPKGRFSDAHKREFGQMDSIANHPSAFRALAKASVPAPKGDVPKSLKRTRSKATLDTPASDDFPVSPVKPTFTPIPARDAALTPAKRLKRRDDVDTSTTRIPLNDVEMASDGKPRTPNTTGKMKIKSGIPLARPGITTPTKASLARSQSVKTLKTQTSIPMLAKSPSLKGLSPARKSAEPEVSSPSPSKTAGPGGLSKATSTSSLRSILRQAPMRLYSDDPSKIAAGTHVPTPKSKSMMPVPATAPVKKHVDFSSSVKDKDELDSMSSPTTAKSTEAFVKISELPNDSSKSVAYPSLAVAYPALSTASNQQATSSARPKAIPKSKRRQTIGPGMPMANNSSNSEFSFRSKHTLSFAAPTAASTIRRVRPSDASACAIPNDPLAGTMNSPKKRKLDEIGEASDESDKENRAKRAGSVAMAEDRPAKKMKPGAERDEGHKKGSGVMSRLPMLNRTNAGKKAASLSRTRLNMLAMPKKRR